MSAAGNLGTANPTRPEAGFTDSMDEFLPHRNECGDYRSGHGCRPGRAHGSTREDLFSVMENGDVAREVPGNHLLIDQVIDQG